MNLEVWMAFLPAFFMLHELEELVGFRRFLATRQCALRQRAPRVAAVLQRMGVFNWSTATFAVGVTHEYLLLLVVVFPALFCQAYHWYWAALVGYTLHLLVHIGQWMAMRCYIPCIITAWLSLPYCVAMLWACAARTQRTLGELALWALLGGILALASFPSAYALMRWHHRWERRTLPTR